MLTRRFFILFSVAIALALAGYFVPLLLVVSKILVAVTSAAAVIDALVCSYAILHLGVKREVAEQMSLNQPNIVRLKVRLKSRRLNDRFFNIKSYISVPQGFVSVSEDCLKGTGEFTYTMTPAARGRHMLGTVRCFVSTRFPGLFASRRFYLRDEYTKVYPTFLHLDKLETMAKSNDMQNGAKRLRKAGNSTDFDTIRAYVPGDDTRTINWKASARAVNLMVNTYTDERSRPIIPVVCGGPSMLTDAEGLSLLDRATSAAVALAASAVKHYDEAGLITLTHEGVETYIKPQRSSATVSSILNAVYDFGLPPTETEKEFVEDPDVLPDGISKEEFDSLLYRQKATVADPNFNALADFAINKIKRRSMLLVFTNLENIDVAYLMIPSLWRMARYHTVVLVLLQNEAVEQVALAPYRQGREDSEKVSSRLSEMRFRAVCANYIEEQQELVAYLKANHVNVIYTTPQNLTIDVLSKYLELKSRNAI